MTTRRRTFRQSAFAAVTAIVLLGLVASTLAALATVFAADARRTRAVAAEAQLRQLLIAGAADVQERLEKGQTSFDVTLATPTDGKIASKSTADGDEVRVTIVATLGARTLHQTLQFQRDGERWKLVEARLNS